MEDQQAKKPTAAEMRQEWDETRPKIEQCLAESKAYIESMTALSNKAHAENQLNASIMIGRIVLGLSQYIERIEFASWHTRKMIEEAELKERGEGVYLANPEVSEESATLSAPITSFLDELAKRKGIAPETQESQEQE